MATNRYSEAVIGMMFPNSMKHLQQLIMDADRCAKSAGQKSFFGKDKFESAVDKFDNTLYTCVMSMVQDGHIKDPGNKTDALKQLNWAMQMLKDTYSSWPLSFQFWESWYSLNQE